MELKAISDLHNLIDWVLPIIAKFPRNFRYSLGVRVENLLYDILELLIKAKYSQKKDSYLSKANINFEIIRHLTRIWSQRGFISIRQYEALSNQINLIGAQIGGWKKKDGK
jgi:hypothetical protein